MLENLMNSAKQGISFVSSNDLPTIIEAFNRRDIHPLLQFMKYGICGMCALVVHMLIFYTFAATIFPALNGSIVDGEPITDSLRAKNSAINNVIAWLFSNLTAYMLNVVWVFQPGRHQKFIEFGLFTLAASIAFTGGLLGGPLLIRFWGIDTHLSQLFFVVTSTAVNYLCRKFYIFKD